MPARGRVVEQPLQLDAAKTPEALHDAGADLSKYTPLRYERSLPPPAWREAGEQRRRLEAAGAWDATLGAFAEVIGLELLDGYVRSSRETLAHVECKWSIHQRDFVSDEGAAVWRDADVVFAASTVFDEAQMARIAARAAALNRGARVVTLDVALPSPHFAVEWLVKCPDCSWGAARAFVQRRV